MKQLEIVKKAMAVFQGSFINSNNELILIPRFNVYFSLDDVESEVDFLCKMCEWVSRDCCTAARFSQERSNRAYWERNTGWFNQVCGTDFSTAEMEKIYQCCGNGVAHGFTILFVRCRFAREILEHRYLDIMEG